MNCLTTEGKGVGRQEEMGGGQEEGRKEGICRKEGGRKEEDG